MKLAVVGHPVAHSRSPVMQEAALSELGLSGWEYGAIDVKPDEFPALVESLSRQGYRGVNVTVPHKEAAAAIADLETATAHEIGAANMLTFTPEGTEADNSDASGLVAALGGLSGTERALVLGAGGASRAAIWALVRAGCVVAVWNRTAERADHVTASLGGAPVSGADARAGNFDLIINGTAAGLGGEDPFEHLPIVPDRFGSGQRVLDMVYSERPSAFLTAASGRGATVIDGLELLVRQGAISFERWTGLPAPLEVMRRAARSPNVA